MRPIAGKIAVTNRQSAGKSFAYLLGVYLGDGCVTHVQGYDRFRLNTIDQDFADATATVIEDLTGRRYPVNGPYQDKRFSQSKPQYQFYCGDRWVCDTLKEQTQEKRVIPEWIFGAEKDVKLAFIAGLMDSEGFVAANANTTNRRFHMGFKSCDLWVLDFVRLLEETGIRTGQISTEEPRKAHYKRPTGFKIKMQSWVNAGAYFRCSRKQMRVKEWASEPAYAQRDRRRLSSTSIRPIP